MASATPAIPAASGAPVAPLLPEDMNIAVNDAPDEHWYSMYHFRGQPLPQQALELLSARIDGTLGFASLRVAGELAAITRATITTGGDIQWLGFSAVEVAPKFRRQGLGTLLGKHILHWGQANGASSAYLEVISSNTAGRALYQGLGFDEHHRRRSLTVG